MTASAAMDMLDGYFGYTKNRTKQKREPCDQAIFLLVGFYLRTAVQ